MEKSEVVKPETKPDNPAAERQKQGKESFKKAQEILAEHGGMASNIPITSPFWDLMNAYRASLQTVIAPASGAVITDPYVQLDQGLIARIPRPPQIESDAREARKHYDRQHPEAQAVLQHEIRKETEALRTDEEKAEIEQAQKEVEERDAETAKRQDEVNQLVAKEDERRTELRKKELEEQKKLREKLLEMQKDQSVPPRRAEEPTPVNPKLQPEPPKPHGTN